MRTLNRPMFRYGGPIKEGVMHGIRESKRNGGSMNRQAALVGNPNFPMQNGRALHSEAATRSALEKIKQATLSTVKNPIKSLNPAKKIGMAKNVGLAVLNPLKNFYRRQVGKLDMPGKFVKKGGALGPGYAGVGQTGSLLQRAKYFASKNPKTTVGGLYLGSGPAVDIASGSVGPLKTVGRQLMDLAVPDFIYDQDAADAEKAAAIELAKKQERDALRKMNSGTDEVITETVEEKTPEQLRKDRIEKYRDIVDIKGMNKDAAYNSLIAASQAISGEGDFKGSLKDGSLINKIIQSTSKAFDKPTKTKDAIDTLILKAEIEKDLNKDKNRLDTEYKKSMIDINKKKLEGSNFAENKAVIKKAGGSGQSGIDDAAALNNDNFRGNIVVKTDLDKVIKGQKEKGILDQKEIVVSYTNTLIEGKELPDGDYTVGDYLVTIQNGKVYDLAR